MKTMRNLPPEQEKFILDNYSGISRKELTDKFNAEFGTDFSEMSMKSWCNRRKLFCGNDGKFKDGNVSWQTGLSGEDYWKHFSEETKQKALSCIKPDFKYNDGDVIIRHGLPCFYKREGNNHDERIEYCSIAVWESVHGKVKEDHIIIHLDGDIMNYNIENLMEIPRSYLPNLRYLGGLTDNIEMNKTKLQYCALREALKENGGNQK